MAASLVHVQRYHEKEHFCPILSLGMNHGLNHFEPESKQQSEQWKYADKNPKQNTQAPTVILTSFLENGTSTNVQSYGETRH